MIALGAVCNVARIIHEKFFVSYPPSYHCPAIESSWRPGLWGGISSRDPRIVRERICICFPWNLLLSRPRSRSEKENHWGSGSSIFRRMEYPVRGMYGDVLPLSCSYSRHPRSKAVQYGSCIGCILKEGDAQVLAVWNIRHHRQASRNSAQPVHLRASASFSICTAAMVWWSCETLRYKNMIVFVDVSLAAGWRYVHRIADPSEFWFPILRQYLRSILRGRRSCFILWYVWFGKLEDDWLGFSYSSQKKHIQWMSWHWQSSKIRRVDRVTVSRAIPMYIHDEYWVYLGLLDPYVLDIFRSDYQPSPMASSWFR